jgi:hypothetical protein
MADTWISPEAPSNLSNEAKKVLQQSPRFNAIFALFNDLVISDRQPDKQCLLYVTNIHCPTLSIARELYDSVFAVRGRRPRSHSSSTRPSRSRKRRPSRARRPPPWKRRATGGGHKHALGRWSTKSPLAVHTLRAQQAVTRRISHSETRPRWVLAPTLFVCTTVQVLHMVLSLGLLSAEKTFV